MRLSNITILAVTLLIVLAIGACAPTPVAPAPTVQSSAASAPAQSAQSSAPSQSNDIKSLWQASKHANTYILEGEENNTCARCHSPTNWLPTSPDEMPATCASCKFTIKPPKPIAKSEWKNIECAQCHKTQKEIVSKEVAWMNSLIAAFDTVNDPYEPVKSTTELCEKCHRDAYKIEIGKSAHASKTCTDCHNPHSTKASCADNKCHPNALKPEKPIAGHDAAHANVNCAACHDAGGWKVQPVGEKKIWQSMRPTDLKGKPNPIPYTSHNLQKSVDCARCHSANNPWGLKVY
jgi:hypothetical protein